MRILYWRTRKPSSKCMYKAENNSDIKELYMYFLCGMVVKLNITFETG